MDVCLCVPAVWSNHVCKKHKKAHHICRWWNLEPITVHTIDTHTQWQLIIDTLYDRTCCAMRCCSNLILMSSSRLLTGLNSVFVSVIWGVRVLDWRFYKRKLGHSREAWSVNVFHSLVVLLSLLKHDERWTVSHHSFTVRTIRRCLLLLLTDPWSMFDPLML